MNRIVRYGFMLVVLTTAFVCADIPLSIGLPKVGDQLFVSVVENRQKQFDKAQQERDQLLKEKEASDQELRSLADETKAQIDFTSKQVELEPANEFPKQKLVLLNESYQVFKDIVRDRERLIGLFDELMKSLREFLDDPDFAVFKQEQRFGERLFYSFEDVQRLYNLILDQEKKADLLTEQERHVLAELDNRKRMAVATKEAYREKKGQIEAGKFVEDETINIQQRNDLIKLEERLYKYKKVLDGLRIKEMEYKREQLSFLLATAKSHLTIYKDYLRTIKPTVRVTDADIVHEREEIAKATNTYRVTKEQYRSEIDKVRVLHDRAEREMQDLSKRYGISLGRDITDWTREVPQSVTAYLAYCDVATLQTQIHTYQRRQELLEAQIELEDEKLKDKNLNLLVKETYNKRFSTEEAIVAEIKKYEGPRAESQAGLSRSKERMSAVTDQISVQKKIVDNIQAMRENLEKQRDVLFRQKPQEYRRCFDDLRRAEAFEKEQIDILSKATGVYSGLTALINNKLRLIGFIIGELESRTIWYRPEYAITWAGIKNIIPDIGNFFTYVSNYFTRGTIVSTIHRLYDSASEPMGLLGFLMKLLSALIILLGIYFLLPRAIALLRGVSEQGIGRVVAMFFAGVCSFVHTYFFSIALWILLFLALQFQDVADTYLYILFYLLSIPYLLYLTNCFIRFMIRFNEDHEYAFVSADFQRRLWLVVSVLLYSTITIFFFREAFMLAHYYRSELPTILLAVNFIIFQIALILLIDKEQILGFLPTRNDSWLFVYEQVNRFYYLMLFALITIIVLSNPYVGFGRLVLYALFAMLYSIVLFLLLYWLHGLFKRTASRVFFATVDDVSRERFANAKTWFGIAIICSFLVLSFLGLVVAAKIWGWPITLSKITEFFYYPLIGGGTETAISMVTFFKILAFVFIGFVAAYGLNRFVLDRIFDLLLIDPGVQHTVSSIAQYLVIITAIFLGFQNAKLGVLVNYIFAGLILGLGWVLKEPISDFVSYFIILVQRPIKIGDYIKVEQDITGVVRKITARSVILRRKNSTTLIVPNSYLISRTIVNWNYTRNFIAFDDIIILVDYKEDPQRVKEVLYKVVEDFTNVLKNPKPWVRLDNFDEYGYEFMVRGFISSVYTLEKWEIASNIRLAIVKAFEEHNIKLAPARLVLTRSNRIAGERKQD